MKDTVLYLLKNIFFPVFCWVFALIIYPRCAAFSPIRIDGLPEDCNMFYTAAQLEYRDKLRPLTAETMRKCSKTVNRAECQRDYYGVSQSGRLNPVDENEAVKFKAYTRCLAERN